MWTPSGSILRQTPSHLWSPPPHRSHSASPGVLNITYILKSSKCVCPAWTSPELQTHISNCQLSATPQLSDKGGSNNVSSQSPSSLVNTCALSTIFTISLNGNPILPVAQAQDHGVIHMSSPSLCPTSNPQKILPITLSKYVHDLTLSTTATLLPATSSLASITVTLS